MTLPNGFASVLTASVLAGEGSVFTGSVLVCTSFGASVLTGKGYAFAFSSSGSFFSHELSILPGAGLAGYVWVFWTFDCSNIEVLTLPNGFGSVLTGSVLTGKGSAFIGSVLVGTSFGASAFAGCEPTGLRVLLNGFSWAFGESSFLSHDVSIFLGAATGCFG